MNRYKDFSDLVDRMAGFAPDRAALLVCDEAGAVKEMAWGELARLVGLRAEVRLRGGAG